MFFFVCFWKQQPLLQILWDRTSCMRGSSPVPGLVDKGGRSRLCGALWGKEWWCRRYHWLLSFSPGQELVQGGLGNVNKGQLKNGREDSQVSGFACRTADRAQPVGLIPRLSWAQEGALDADPSRSIRRTCLAAQGPFSFYFLTLLCPASQSFQGRGTSVMLAPREIFIPQTLAFESTSTSAESPEEKLMGNEPWCSR